MDTRTPNHSQNGEFPIVPNIEIRNGGGNWPKNENFQNGPCLMTILTHFGVLYHTRIASNWVKSWRYITIIYLLFTYFYCTFTSLFLTPTWFLYWVLSPLDCNMPDVASWTPTLTESRISDFPQRWDWESGWNMTQKSKFSKWSQMVPKPIWWLF